jgi:ribonuclease R
VLPLVIERIDAQGDPVARPIEGPAVEILLPHDSFAPPVPGIGDRLIAKLFRQKDGSYEGRPIRVLPRAPKEVVGLVEQAGDGLRLRPSDRKARTEYRLVTEPGDAVETRPGDLVRAAVIPGWRDALPRARVVERLGKPDEPRAISLVAAVEAGIPIVFPGAAVELADAARPVGLDGRVDLRDRALVTIDGEDARDFDDAVWAEPDGKGGWTALVAIADVAWYVRPGDALDREAARRGNSVYFPDRVVPMLPEKLSNDLCSLRPNEDRACLAVEIAIDGHGHLGRHRFMRGLMRSSARLTYEQVEAFRLGDRAVLPPELHARIEALQGVYAALRAAREKRGAIDLESSERKVQFDQNLNPTGFVPRPSLDSHKLIEELMIAANVCAAITLEEHATPCMYRVHDKPDPVRLAALAEFLAEMGLPWAKASARPGDFTKLLRRVEEPAMRQLVSTLILRSQAQAVYSPRNIGHFGLNLRRYAHFTSPIRRYADLLVHRGLIRALKLGEGGLPADQDVPALVEIGESISMTERRAMAAERAAYDRFVALYMAVRTGAVFRGHVTGATKVGLFVQLDDTGADGFVPVSSLGREWFEHDERFHALIGERTGEVYAMGDRVEVELVEADPLLGRLLFRLVDHVAGAGAARAAAARRGGRKTRRPPHRRRRA